MSGPSHFSVDPGVWFSAQREITGANEVVPAKVSRNFIKRVLLLLPGGISRNRRCAKPSPFNNELGCDNRLTTIARYTHTHREASGICISQTLVRDGKKSWQERLSPVGAGSWQLHQKVTRHRQACQTAIEHAIDILSEAVLSNIDPKAVREPLVPEAPERKRKVSLVAG